jgi:hypothetical protein
MEMPKLGDVQIWQAFDQILKKCEPRDVCKRDAYATSQLATLQLKIAMAAGHGGTKPEDLARVDKATEMYRSVRAASVAS